MSRSDKLGKLIDEHVCLLQSSNHDWLEYVSKVKKRSCIPPDVGRLPHPAAPLLDELRTTGAPATFSSPPWEVEKNDEAVRRGCHQSAKEYQGFLEDEMATFVERGYYVVLPYREVRHLEGLRLCPIGVVPQRKRQPRPISDYTFYGTNADTIKRAPQEAMQFGRTLDRMLAKIHHADDRHGPVYMLMVDISDGFYRVPLRAEHIPSLGMVLPYQEGEEPHVAFPLVLPMGWTESPPFFCTLTETVIDLVNERLGHWDPPPHPLEKVAATPPPPPDDRKIKYIAPATFPDSKARRITMDELPPAKRAGRPPHKTPPLAYGDVYVDDEGLLGQGTEARLNRLRRVLLHINDLVFRPNDADDDAERKEPCSVKKMKQGDACWSTTHVFLGWLIDTLKGTIELPPHRKERLVKILSEIRGRKRCTEKAMHKLLGELRSMSQAIPGCRGLFSQLQYDLSQKKGHRVRLRQATQDHLEDIAVLATDLDNRPTRLGEVVPSRPRDRGASDAAKSGMGGVWFQPTDTGAYTHPPIAWRYAFPDDIQKRVVSFDNPGGDITNSDLELAATIIQEAVLAEHCDVAESTITTGCDNTAAVSWRTHGSTTTKGPAAYLLRTAGLLQRQHRYRSEVFYLPGEANVLADAASRRFDLSDSALLAHLSSIAPQIQPWLLVQVPEEVCSTVLSDLRCKRQSRPSLHSVQRPATPSGKSPGSRSWLPATSTILTSLEKQTRYTSCLPTHSSFDKGQRPVVVDPSSLTPYEITYSRYRRRSPYWVNETPDLTRATTSTGGSPVATELGQSQIPPRSE
mmetsp:Transcript_50704/g.122309  ORF Transcript_50704/g.122309 Transcript_50704/m.122309 type:complete len:800 (-) Transcript_50704:1111-3510(-)